MIVKKLLLTSLIALFLFACGGNRIGRDRWESMTPQQKELTVRAFLGGESAEDAKGGRGSRYSRPVAAYIDEIDRRYREGESRDVEAFWPELRDR